MAAVGPVKIVTSLLNDKIGFLNNLIYLEYSSWEDKVIFRMSKVPMAGGGLVQFLAAFWMTKYVVPFWIT